MAQKPLLLKDYLELDPNSDSCNSFASFPRNPASSTTIRFLLEAERCQALDIRSSAATPTRSPSKSGGGAFTKISAAINNAVKNFPLSSPTRPRPRPSRNGDGDSSRLLSRNFSKKLTKKFWKKKEMEEHKVTVKDIVRSNSFELCGESKSLYYPSPVVSSRSSSCCSDGDEERSESFLSLSSSSSNSINSSRLRRSQDRCSDGDEERSESFLLLSSSSSNSINSSGLCRSQDRQRSPAEEKSQGLECQECQSMEEKEQLSPVSVMDFPYQGDEAGEASSVHFVQSLANIERTTHQLLQKIRRFETPADLDPLDLELTFASSEDDDIGIHVAASPDEITAWGLIGRLKTTYQLDPQTEKLVLDFFLDALSWTAGTRSADADGMVSAAGNWIDGRGCLKPEEHGRAQLAEMERSGRWRSFEDGKDDVAADVEGRLFGSLMQEVVLDLAYGLVQSL